MLKTGDVRPKSAFFVSCFLIGYLDLIDIEIKHEKYEYF